MKTPSILITGATGTVGRELTRQLAEQGHAFRVMVRSLDKAEPWRSLPSAEVVMGDFEDASSLRTALQGIDRAFLLSPSSEKAEAQQLAFLEAARQTGLKHLVKLSQLAADENSPVRFLRYHAAVEKAIQQTGMEYTFLRPNLFMQGLLGFKDLIRATGQFFASAGEAPVSVIDVRDIARVALHCLTEEGHQGKTYTLTGPQALTHREMAAELSLSLGTEVRYTDVPSEEMHQGLLQAGFPEWQAAGLMEDYAHYSRQEAAFLTSAVEEITGAKPLSFRDFARDYAEAFLR